MHAYIARRLLLLIPALFLLSILIFIMLRIIPGDAALLKVAGGQDVVAADEETYQLIRRQLGLDRPHHEQYLDWLWRMVRYGDLGASFFTRKPVLQEIFDRLPVTVELAVGATLVSLLIALPAGVVSAVRQDTGLDYLGRLTAVIGLSVPGFWIGTLMIVLPAFWFGYIGPLGYVSPLVNPWSNFQQFIFPSLALGAAFSATVMRLTRSQMLEVLRQDYIRTAWSKGLRERAVIYRHALKNALLPVLTIVGLDFGYLLGRTVVIEAVFTLPGLGTSTLSAIINRDYPQLQGNVLFIALMFVLVNLVVDVLYAVVDPRIRYQ